MSNLPQLPVITLFLGLGLILMVVCGVITWTTQKSFRINSLAVPKMKYLIAIAFLQTLLGVVTLLIVKGINNEPFTAIGSGLGMTFLSGLFFMLLILKDRWKPSLRVWAVATALQLMLVPICSVVLLAGLMLFQFWLFPPQF
jgi:hypothetical protein